MKHLLHAAASLCLVAGSVMVGSALAQEAVPASGQAEQPEWQALLDRASAMYDNEASKSDAQRNYKAILATVAQAEQSAINRFGAGSSPHQETLHARARYLGLSGAYDAQLETARKILGLELAPPGRGSLNEAASLLMFTANLTYDQDSHKAAGAQALRQAAEKLTALKSIYNDDIALTWLAYAKQMPHFGGTPSDRIKILKDIIKFRESENPRNDHEHIKALWMLGDAYNSLDTREAQFSAMTTYRDAATMAQADLRPENGDIGIAQFKYGDQLLTIGRTVEAELYLEEAVKTLTGPGPGADPEFAKAARARLAEARGEGPTGSSAVAQQEVAKQTEYKEEFDGWTVQSKESYCAVSKKFERGVVAYIDYDERKNIAIFAIIDPSFQSIKDGEEYKLYMDVPLKDGETALYGQVQFVGRVADGIKAISTELLGKEFLSLLEKASHVRVKRGEISVADIDVSEGSGRHLLALRHCAETRAKESPSDPFSN